MERKAKKRAIECRVNIDFEWIKMYDLVYYKQQQQQQHLCKLQFIFSKITFEAGLPSTLFIIQIHFGHWRCPVQIHIRKRCLQGFHRTTNNIGNLSNVYNVDGDNNNVRLFYAHNCYYYIKYKNRNPFRSNTLYYYYYVWKTNKKR